MVADGVLVMGCSLLLPLHFMVPKDGAPCPLAAISAVSGARMQTGRAAACAGAMHYNGGKGDSPDPRRSMSESSHTAPKQRVDAAPAGGDDRKGARRGAIFIGLVLVAYIVYLVLTGQILEFAQAMSSVQMSWIAVACLCMVLYFIFGVAAYAIAVWLDPDSPVGIRDLVSVEASGVFFGNLTPMMVGGTPAQIYRLTKAGQPVGEAGATQFTRYIVFQIGLVVWGAILLAVRLPFFTSLYGDMTLLCLFSFGGHVLLLTGLFIVCLCPRFVVRVAMWGIRFVERVTAARASARAVGATT